eukprot:CAMPEP_0170621722 /NCGR_PEP_ID=MMETSP0224-20130122/28751_1 /TAXON_ID=285029 /ORGANISM="Togula jolla, Strain CCCM 725" /LENGTH=550 /DNA_ID=CAMNT_0010947997 /DNA_START=68 /DNA_END=1721 /DNA_ORIENTATION=-
MTLATITVALWVAVQPAVGIQLVGRKGSSANTSSSGTSRTPLTNHDDIEYTAQVSLGGMNLDAVLDTGSFDVVILSTECDWACGDVSLLYDHKKSHTYEEGTLIAEQFYGSGSTESLECWEEFDAGFGKRSHQVFWKVFDADMSLLQESSFQAIVGLGPPQSSIALAQLDEEEAKKRLSSLSAGTAAYKEMEKTAALYKTIAEHAAEATSLAKNLELEAFSICLGKKAGSDGYFMWQDTDPNNRPNGMFRTVPALNDLYWSASLSDVSLGSLPSSQSEQPTKLGCHDGKKCNVIFDTGTSLIMVPSTAMKAVQEALDKWRDISGDCTKLSQLPDLVFTVGGEKVTLPPQSYVGEIFGDLQEIDPALHRFMPHLRELGNRQRKQADGGSALMADGSEEDDEDYDWEGYSNYDWGYDGSYGMFGGFSDNCAPLLMTLDLETDQGEAWLFGVPFFREYYTTFKFKQQSAHPPVVPESISFATTDEDCHPKETSSENFLPQSEERPRLRVDAAKLRVPGGSARGWMLPVEAQRFPLPASRFPQMQMGKMILRMF